jgi:hypothetical protein
MVIVDENTCREFISIFVWRWTMHHRSVSIVFISRYLQTIFIVRAVEDYSSFFVVIEMMPVKGILSSVHWHFLVDRNQCSCAVIMFGNGIRLFPTMIGIAAMEFVDFSRRNVVRCRIRARIVIVITTTKRFLSRSRKMKTH